MELEASLAVSSHVPAFEQRHLLARWRGVRSGHWESVKENLAALPFKMRDKEVKSHANDTNGLAEGDKQNLHPHSTLSSSLASSLRPVLLPSFHLFTFFLISVRGSTSETRL